MKQATPKHALNRLAAQASGRLATLHRGERPFERRDAEDASAPDARIM